jgi:hypothetical protein
MLLVVTGGKVNNTELAVKIAELLIANVYGEEELHDSEPLLRLIG